MVDYILYYHEILTTTRKLRWRKCNSVTGTLKCYKLWLLDAAIKKKNNKKQKTTGEENKQPT